MKVSGQLWSIFDQSGVVAASRGVDTHTTCQQADKDCRLYSCRTPVANKLDIVRRPV